MRQILSKTLAPETQTYLNGLQSKIINGSGDDADVSFAAQVKRAKTTWKPDTRHFKDIKAVLKDMTVAGRCNYCEADRACDIEHIYPKSKFPELAYTWTNYILACKFCNSYLKSDKFAVFSPKDSTIKIDLKRNAESVTEDDAPPSDDGLLINPRTENPQNLIRLDLIGQTFLYQPIGFDPATRDYQRADYTIDLLDLKNEDLIQAMRNQNRFFISSLEKYKMVKDATDFDTLKAIIGDFPFIKDKGDFFAEQQRMLLNLKNSIQNAMYPTIWDELKRQRKYLLRTKALFDALPEVLLW